MTISAPIAEGAGAPEPVSEAESLRVASWPNAVTGLRIVMVPVLVGSFFVGGAGGLWLGFAVFAAAALSDFFRRLAGAEARSAFAAGPHPRSHRRQAPGGGSAGHAGHRRTRAGDRRGGDPLAEFLISGLREALAGKVALPVQPLAKWKTAAQMAAIALLLLAPAVSPWLTEDTGAGLASAGEGLLWLAVVLTWASAIGYVRGSVRGLRKSGAKRED